MTRHHSAAGFVRISMLLALLLMLGSYAVVEAAPVSAASGKTQRGAVMSGKRAIIGSRVTLYATGGPAGPRVLGSARTRRDGSFRIGFPRPARRNETRYVVAEGGKVSGAARTNRAIRFATVLGKGHAPRYATLNERTTVATAFALAQFFEGRQLDGPSPGLPNAAATFRNLVNLRSGAVGRVLARPPNGSRTSTMRTFQSLANLLAACVRDSDKCDQLFELAQPRGGAIPGNTLAAAHDIATNPAHRAAALFRQSLKTRVYRPALRVGGRPDAWTLALRYDAGGGQFNGPGATAFDRRGNAWIVNNYIFSLQPRDSREIVCGGDQVLKLKPNGHNFPGAPYQGGGLYGAGFGITIGKKGDVWVGDFAFQGTKCKYTEQQQANRAKAVSQIAADGTILSPDTKPGDPGGWSGKKNAIFRPQGMATDRRGGIWVSSCGNDNVVLFRDANPNRDAVFTAAGLDKPFDVTIDPQGLAWVSSNGSDAVYAFDRQGNVVRRLTGQRAKAAGIFLPMGVASDSKGNIWVSNSGVLDAPCKSVSDDSMFDAVRQTLGGDFQGKNASMTMIRPNGRPFKGGPFKGGGLLLPWGVAIDGDDKVWVANFDGRRISNLCGASTSKCPAGKRRIGAPISPRGGYSSNGLRRVTDVSIDPSGNVWATNNWRIFPNPANPGGHQMVVFIGLATPVRTPLIGAPRTP